MLFNPPTCRNLSSRGVLLNLECSSFSKINLISSRRKYKSKINANNITHRQQMRGSLLNSKHNRSRVRVNGCFNRRQRHLCSWRRQTIFLTRRRDSMTEKWMKQGQEARTQIQPQTINSRLALSTYSRSSNNHSHFDSRPMCSTG